MKKLLIISYYWPPAGGGSVQRWLHFAKNLKLLGAEPVVLTVNESNASYPLLDATLCTQVYDIETIRTKSFELLKLYSRIKKGNATEAIPYGGLPQKKSLFTWISAWIRGNVFLPDARVGWNKFAIKAAVERIKKGDITHIITTGPPHSSHLIGLYLKKEFPAIPWIADFRDPWTELYINETLPQTNWAKRRNEQFEIAVLKTADKVITVGNEMVKLLAGKIQDKAKISAIYNGFDEAAFSNYEIKTTSKFILLHVGLLGDKQDISPIAKAVKLLATNENSQFIVFKVIGKISENLIKIWRDICPEIELENAGYLSQKETISAMFQANVLINITAETSHEQILVSTKTMEYLRVGLPILTINNKGLEFEYLFQNNKFLRVFTRVDEVGINLFLQELFNYWKRKESPTSKIDVSNFSRQQSSKKLLELLD